MKRIIFALAAVSVLFASCQKTAVNKNQKDGFLSFGEFSLDVDDSVITKSAVAASGTYRIAIQDADGTEIMGMSYSEVKNNDNMITLPAGSYTLVATSEDSVPFAAFERPVYGTSKDFKITAGEVTNIGQLVCELLQCKVTVDYSDEFLAAVTGEGSTTVTLKAGHPLKFALKADKTYEKQAGYFAVDGTTLEVEFQGTINGKNQKMSTIITGITPKQWRQIKFVQKKNEQGNATFAIAINDLVSDEVLNNVVSPKEDVIDSYDPQAPKGDGGITLVPDYEGGCDPDVTVVADPADETKKQIVMNITDPKVDPMVIKLLAKIPAGVKKFNVSIETDNTEFKSAVDLADAANLDLINPSATNEVIFVAVPFPHGQELLGKTEVLFDLTAAQSAIYDYPGTHLFTMTIRDNDGCSNVIPVTMIVNR